MTLKVKVAGIQIDPKIGKKEKNLENIVNHIRSVALEKTQLIVFPECVLTGYCYNSLEEAVPVTETSQRHHNPQAGDTPEKEVDHYFITVH